MGRKVYWGSNRHGCLLGRETKRQESNWILYVSSVFELIQTVWISQELDALAKVIDLWGRIKGESW